ncbi:MAG: porin family protein [Bacteroidota bacterium]
MKQIYNILAVVFLMTNMGFSQSGTSPKPVKKIVSSKITKDPKTGKVVKTITTTTITDVVLNPGNQPANTLAKSSVKPSPKPVVKKTITKQKTMVVTKKPVSQAKVIAAKPKPEPAKAVVATKKEDNGSIFSNPTDHSTKNEIKITDEKNVTKTTVNTTSTQTNAISSTTTTKQVPTKIFKENEKVNNSSSHLGVRLGVNRAGVENVSSITVIPSATVNNRLSINAGVFFNLAFSKIISVQPEINYSEQGYDLTNGIDTERLKNQAINIPILLKATVGGEQIKFFVNGGPYVGYLLKSEKLLKLNETKISYLVDFKAEEGKETTTNRFDYGVQGGAGIQINLGGPKLEIEGRYNYGLADPMVYYSTKPSYVGQTGRNRILTGTIGLMIPIGK